MIPTRTSPVDVRRTGGTAPQALLELVDLSHPLSFKPCDKASWLELHKHRRVLLIDDSGPTMQGVRRRTGRANHAIAVPKRARPQRQAIRTLLLDPRRHLLAELLGTTSRGTQTKSIERIRAKLGDRPHDGGYELIHVDGEHVWFELPAGELGFLLRRPAIVAPASPAPSARPLRGATLVVRDAFYRPALQAVGVALRLENATAPMTVLKDFVLLWRDREFREYRNLHYLRDDNPDYEWLPFGGALKAKRRDCSPLFWCGFEIPDSAVPTDLTGALMGARVRGFLLAGGGYVDSNEFELDLDDR